MNAKNHVISLFQAKLDENDKIIYSRDIGMGCLFTLPCFGWGPFGSTLTPDVSKGSQADALDSKQEAMTSLPAPGSELTVFQRYLSNAFIQINTFSKFYFV